MELENKSENKVVNDLFRSTGESLLSKNTSVTSDLPNASAMMFKLNNVRSLSELDESKLNSLLKFIDTI